MSEAAASLLECHTSDPAAAVRIPLFPVLALPMDSSLVNIKITYLANSKPFQAAPGKESGTWPGVRKFLLSYDATQPRLCGPVGLRNLNSRKDPLNNSIYGRTCEK